MLVVVVLVLSSSPSARAVPITVGQNFAATTACDGMTMQTGVGSGTSYTFPSSGTITSWSTMAVSAGNRMAAVVWRPAGLDAWTLVGSSDLEVPTGAGLKTFATSIAVEAGDVLAQWVEERNGINNINGTCSSGGAGAGATSVWWYPDLPFPGSTPDPDDLNFDTGWLYDISVELEPGSTPGAPATASATAGNAEATVTWTAPASDGGAAITGYAITVAPTTGVTGLTTRTAAAGDTNLVFTGLTNGTAYTFTVAATNSAGTGTTTATSAVTPAAVPDAPATASATAGSARATVAWTAPASDGGAAITGYAITVAPTTGVTGLTTRTAAAGDTNLVFTGLTNGTAYTFTVAATNSAGTGTTTATSAVTPSAPRGGGGNSSDDPSDPEPDSTPDPEPDDDLPSTPALPVEEGDDEIDDDDLGDGEIGDDGLVASVDLGGESSIGVTDDGRVVTTDPDDFFGDLTDTDLNAPITTLSIHWTQPTKATTWQATGYWLVSSDGGVFAFGTARFHGSTGDRILNRPIVGISPTRTGNGYWLVAADGGVFTFGDARYHGSTGALALNQPVVGILSTTTGHGYWLAASDGGVFTFGDARYHGSAARSGLKFIGIARTEFGRGYWLIATDGIRIPYGYTT